jgi:Amt family ammonium transporter
MLAGAAGAISAMAWVWMKYGKPDPSMLANGMLAGLVAITAPCAFVTAPSAVVIGLVAGLLVCWAVVFFEKTLKLDDPVGAISVHGVNGLFGVLAVGIFANGSYGNGWNGAVDSEGNPIPLKGVIKGEWGQLGAQAVGALVIVTVIFGVAYAFFKIHDMISKSMGKGGIRSKEEDEIAGLDLPEMGVQAYPEFVQS